jgi:hypothetical protein
MNDINIKLVCEKAMVQETGLQLKTIFGDVSLKPGFKLGQKEVVGYDENNRLEGVRYEDILSAETTT